MMSSIKRDVESDPIRFVLAASLMILLGWWFLAVNASGRISLHAGPRMARGTFEADRLTSPDQFNGALIVIAVLFLVAFVAAFSAAWDLVAASRRGSDQP